MKKAAFCLIFAIVFLSCFSQSIEILGKTRSEAYQKAISQGYKFIKTTGDSKESDIYEMYYTGFTIQLHQLFKEGKCEMCAISGPTQVNKSLELYNEIVSQTKPYFQYNSEMDAFLAKNNEGRTIVFQYSIVPKFGKWNITFGILPDL